jgi:hypothetical protein
MFPVRMNVSVVGSYSSAMLNGFRPSSYSRQVKSVRCDPRFNDYPAANRNLCAVGKHKAGDLGIDMHAVNHFSDYGSLEEAHGLSNRQEGAERTELSMAVIA